MRNFIKLQRILIFITVISVAPSFAQEVITHGGSGYAEDGTITDADGLQNGIIVWKGGATHRVTSNMTFWNSSDPDKSYKLRIEPGAIVEFEGDITLSGGGNLTSVLQIEGATLKGVPDPDNFNNILTFKLNFWGGKNPNGEHSFIKNSSIENLHEISPLGWMEIRDSKISGFPRSIRAATPTTVDMLSDAVSLIVGNEFEDETNNGHPIIDMSGGTSTIIGNTFKTKIDAIGSTSYAIHLGYMQSEITGEVFPREGINSIRLNTFLGGGIDMFSLYQGGFGNPYVNFAVNDELIHATLDNYPLSVEIDGNTFDGTEVQGGRVSALWEIPIFSNISVTRNKVLNYGKVMNLQSLADSPGGTRVRTPTLLFRINNNEFSSNKGANRFSGISFDIRVTGSNFVDQFVAENAFVNAENNDWGHPTGPSDLSDQDGVTNSGGGLEVEDGIDYKPFVGQAPPGDIDQTLGVIPESSPPFIPNTTVQFTPEVRYSLSSGSGDLELEIRTDKGEVLINPRPKIHIDAGENQTISFDEIEINIPENTNKLIFQSIFFGEAGTGAYSNNVVFDVQFQTSQISIIKFEVFSKDEDGNDVEVTELIPGSDVTVNLEVRYKFTPSGGPPEEGTIEIFPKERVRSSPQLFLKIFPTQQATAISDGNNNTESFNNIHLQVPLNNFSIDPTEIVFEAKLTTDAGVEVTTERTIPVDKKANSVMWKYWDLTSSENVFKHRTYFLADQPFILGFQLSANVKTLNVDNWEMQPTILFFNEQNELISTFRLYATTNDNEPLDYTVKTGQTTTMITAAELNSPIPPDSKYGKLFLDLFTDTGTNVARDSVRVEVKQPQNSSEQPVPAGDAVVDMDPLPILLDVHGNQQAGSVKGFELEGPMPLPDLNVIPKLLAKLSDTDEYIQLNRFWDFVSDLEPGTFSADITFTYSPEEDFPENVTFDENSLVITILDTSSLTLVELPTQHDTANNSLTTSITDFNEIFVLGVPSALAVGVEEEMEKNVPEAFQLKQNYPNPFNPETRIEFLILQAGFVKLEVFNLLGQKVKTLVDSEKLPGSYTVVWNSRDNLGHPVATGVYIYRLVTREFAKSRKMLLLR